MSEDDAKPPNWYELKQAKRRKRYEELADQADREATASHEAADRLSSFIPLGQPILIGHHSERRHRRDLERIRRHTQKAFEAQEKSQDYARKAASVGSGGISSDDPEAVDKLKARLAELEERHAQMKAANRQAPGTYPAYALQNSNANLRRIRERIKALEKAATRQTTQTTVPGLTIRQDVEENRVMLIFERIPSPEIRALCQRHGFKWSPSRRAWVRFLNAAGIWAAECVSQAFVAQTNPEQSPS